MGSMCCQNQFWAVPVLYKKNKFNGSGSGSGSGFIFSFGFGFGSTIIIKN
jgi:hypothetical protein